VEISLAETGSIIEALDRINQQMVELRAEIPVEFAAWQTEDMRRKQAITRTIDVARATSSFTRAATVIWPTSIIRVRRRRRLVRRRRRKGIEARISRGSRPVLRKSLIERFHERFRSLVYRSLA
jgi:hypothetical protein